MIAPVFIGLAILDVLLLVAVLRPRLGWLTKLALIVAVLGFNFTVIGAQDSGTGYAAPATPADGAQMVACYVIEPAGSSQGAVYVWLLPPDSTGQTFGYKPTAGEPRAYRLPYSRKLQAGCEAAKEAIKRGGLGTRVALRIKKGRRGAKTPVHFYQLPPAVSQLKEVHP